MTADTREGLLVQTFVTLADTLVDDYDVVDLLQKLVDACRDLLDATEAGILIADGSGQLELVASTSEASRLVEMMQLSASEGPCIECFRIGMPVSVPDIDTVPTRWSAFRESALAQGFASMDAVPLRLRDQTIGALNLLRSTRGEAPPADLQTARAFADVATIGILHERTLRESEILTGQLQSALDSRVTIEQAKGVVSHTRHVPVDEAFSLIRAYARRHRMGVSAVAAALVNRTLELPAEES